MNLSNLNPFARTQKIETKASKTGPLIWMLKRGQPQYTPDKYDRIAKVGYERNPIGKACVDHITKAMTGVPVLLYERQGKKRKEVEDHKLLDLLKRPSPIHAWQDFVRAAVSYRLLAGNVFFERVQAGTEVREIYALRPDRMKLTVGRGGVPEEFIYTVQGQKMRWRCDYEKGAVPVWQWKDFHPTDDAWGLGVMRAVGKAADTYQGFVDYMKGLLDNGATPSGAFVYRGNEEGGGHMPDSMFDRLKKMIEEGDMSGGKSGKPLILEGGLEWQAFQHSPHDMQALEGMREAARTIALTFGVPPMILGIPGDNTYSNYKEANAAFYRDTVLPLLDDFLSNLTRWLAPAFGDADGKLSLGYDEDQIPALAAERNMLWERARDADWIDIDEKREMTGFGALPDTVEDKPGKQIYAAANKAPINAPPPDGDESTGLDVEPPPAKPNGKDKVNGATVQ